MFIPTVIPYIRHFYPLGNTPAVSLTRGLPQGIDADILLLGCGDVRNILFTAYCERGFPPRSFGITCCDIEPAVIARNVLLFTLLIDGVSADNAWNIYFHLRIDQDSKKLVKDQAQKIISLSESIDQWNEGRYGSVLRFCDASSLQQVRQIWMKYASSQSKSEASFKEDIERARNLVKLMTGQTEGESHSILTGLRSVAPLLVASKGEVSQVNDHFWKNGTVSKRPAKIPNPTFSEALSANTYLHYGTDPILGFHLATALANLAPTSPLRPSNDDEVINVVAAAAKTEFREWVASFQEIPEGRMTVRFAVSDALSFSHGLKAISTSEKSTSIFRRQLDITPVELDPAAYGTANSAPKRFDVIDTSNLADHLGALNLLVAAAPLLKGSASSTLWMETLLKRGKTRKQQFDALLYGHAPTMSLLLGVAPVDFWTNATSVSCVDEVVMNSMASSEDLQQTHSRLAWKLDAYFSPQPSNASTFTSEPLELAKAIFQVYTHMFEAEDPQSFMGSNRDEALAKIQNSSYPLFHRGSFAALVKHIQSNTSTDWPSFWEYLLAMINQDGQDTSTLRNLYRQELGAQLHLQGLHTEKWLREEVSPKPSLGGFNAWKDIPEVVCVTVVVPRKQIDNLYNSDISKINAPTLEGVIESGSSLGWQNLFANLHVAFGHVETSGDREADDFSITIRQDPLGWQGKSPLVASFYVPSGALQAEPKGARIGLNIQNTVLNVRTFRHLLPTMAVYKTAISDTSNVFVTRYEPGMSGYPFTGAQANIIGRGGTTQADSATNTQITANFVDNKIKFLCGHVDFFSEQSKKLLTDRVPIELRQLSPFSIDILFGKKVLVHPVSFPAPVLNEGAKTRIARTSGYIEVIVPLADPLTSEPLSSFIYPMTLGEGSMPIPLNSQHVNLDSLPILDVDQAHKKSNSWLTMLTSHQFSVRERRLRDSSDPPSLRMNFKESLFSMFMLASGLQGGSTGLFTLEHPEDGNQILIFVRAIRLNGAEGSIVADAAVVPLTRELIDSKELEPFLYILRELQICAIKVNDGELALWKTVLPALAERCRTWTHGPKCEYKTPGATIPLSTEMGKPFMCSCGKGKLPAGFMRLPDWDEVAAKHAVRIAISPTFSVPFVEDVVDTDLLKAQGGIARLRVDKCRNCNATKGRNSGGLMKCSRCKEVMYCSPDCQRKDWKKHRMECKAHDVA
ncbi:hypothetical protein GGS26DRAFT_589327 [Hypomontagnella submonticulosa]|nr:hypothetical protein GGS26DRAFT_589327 [Hypomontagnella submonticulosa]